MRKKRAEKRKIQPDPKYQNILVAKFINRLMKDGQKLTAQKVLYQSFNLIEKQKKDPLAIFEQAIKNITPTIEVRSKRIGGANYQVPQPVRSDRQISLAIRWVITICQKKSGQPMAERLAKEFLAASQNEGEALKRKENVHKMAEANKAFAHFARH